MTVYSLDVEVSTHDALQRGIVALPVMQSQHAHTRITVDADNDGEAVLIATQIAACHHMPTAAYLRV